MRNQHTSDDDKPDRLGFIKLDLFGDNTPDCRMESWRVVQEAEGKLPSSEGMENRNSSSKTIVLVSSRYSSILRVPINELEKGLTTEEENSLWWSERLYRI
ncbi:hypothetical protein LOD99_5512 [Oopsacas minuta]|uniref:Uncharacterized protein n=1 Tax=Oopsacas minuta TaxID=111878 RepID=A0AAV7JS19_9METZ|nr:hypothetical protein LOD99_5512 [Oopsacas minuta]